MASFEKPEYLDRIAKTKARMEEAGIEVLLVTNPGNMNYLSGYDGWSFYVHQMVILALDQDVPIWVGREQDAAGAKVTVFMSHDNIRSYTDEYVDATDKHCMHFIAALLKEKGWDGRRLGVEMDTYYFTARCYEELKRSLPNATFVDAHSLVNWVRIVKSPQEIEYMRQAGKIVQRAMEVGIDAIEPGVREYDAVAKVYQAQISGAAGYGGDYPACVPIMPSGEKTATPHLTWSDDTYKSGTATNLELGGCRFRYHSALARTVFLGDPPQRLTDLAASTADGLHAALETARPGWTCHDIEASWRAVISKAGFEKRSRLGYSIGLNYPPNWGEHTASLREGDMTVLAPNMCFHMIMGMWMDGWGYSLSETFRVTDGEPETFADMPRKLYVKP